MLQWENETKGRRVFWEIFSIIIIIIIVVREAILCELRIVCFEWENETKGRRAFWEIFLIIVKIEI